MSLMDHRQKRIVPEQRNDGQSLQTSGLTSQDVSVEQLPFPDNPTPPVEAPQVQQYQFSQFGNAPQAFGNTPTPPGQQTFGNAPMPPGQQSFGNMPMVPGQQSFGNLPVSANVTQVLVDLSASANVTRQLTQMGMLPERTTTTNLRQPVIIRGTGKKSRGAAPPPPPKKRRMMVHVAVTALLLFIVISTLIAVIPLGTEGRAGGYNPFQPIINLVNTNSNNTGLIAQQAATATAVTQDGYDQGNQTYAGVQSAPLVPAGPGGTLNRFFYGQCTYWANMRYHQLTGNWVTWLGNANQWSYGAAQSGWVVSPTPKVPSIVVLQPYVEGAGGYGHVAVVEKINDDGSVLTTNFNWAGNWA